MTLVPLCIKVAICLFASYDSTTFLLQRTTLNMPWYDNFTSPDSFQLRNIGSKDWFEFIQQSEQISPTINDYVLEAIGSSTSNKKVLDFGCGIGRVALKLWYDHKLPSHGCDINPEAISYLKSQIQGPDLHVNSFKPPLKYSENFFDLIFSISIWTHLPPDLQIPWLKEMHRILIPGGTALISISSASSLPIRKKRLPMWEAHTEEDLKREGILFVEYRYLEKNPEAYPGVTDSYGSTLHDFDYIQREWGKVFSEVTIKPKAIANSQDLVVLRK